MSGASVTEALAEWVVGFDETQIGPGPRERLKLSILDAIGCAYLARASAATTPILSALDDLGGGGSATVIGESAGATGSAQVPTAVLANATLIRALDFNDHQALDPNDGARLGGHPSDILAVALTIGEWRGCSGAEMLTAAAMGYEIFGRAQKLLGRDHVWDHVTVHGLTAPAVAGKLMGLDTGSMADALSLGVAHATTPGAVRRGALSSAKFLAGPMVLEMGTRAAILAAHGTTGPRTVFEDANKGISPSVYPDPAIMAAISAPMAGRPMIEGVTIKAYPGLDTSQAPITAVLGAREAFGGALEDVAQLTLALAHAPMVRRQIEDRVLTRPANRETADHSLYYLAAVALVEGEVTEPQYARELWFDARVIDLMARVKMEMDRDLTARAPDGYPCRARITTVSGAQHASEVLYAPGHARNPMTADGIIAKFNTAVAGHMDNARSDRIIETVLALEEAPSVGDLTALLAG